MVEKLSQHARDAVAAHPNSDIEVALAFLVQAMPSFLGESNDRLVKLGRRILYLVNAAEEDSKTSVDLEQGLALLLEECHFLSPTESDHAATAFKVPRVRFGKTGLQMPIVTLGCMRFQQEWGPRITQLNQVGSDCQDNLVAILKRAVDFGMIHIETARGYGCSELQLGVALKQLFLTDYVKREDLIIQTKIPANEDPVAFREALQLSMKNLQVDYVDLFAFHGMNYEEQLEWVFGREGNNCLAVVKEYMAAGKIRHLGFSTHGSTDLIIKCINMDVFDYVNLHYHYFGSYTASGGGQDGLGNLDAIKLLDQKDIGRFIISPFDKGGRLYAPSKKLCSLTLPEMEPMTFKSLWLWNHHRIYQELPQLHTYTVGAARPADLDQPAFAAYLHATKPDEILNKTTNVTKRLDDAKEKALGKEWVANWWKGLPKATGSKYQVEHNQIVWIYNLISSFGLFEFGKARYHSFENNEAKWDETKSLEENIANIGKNGWGFVPGTCGNARNDGFGLRHFCFSCFAGSSFCDAQTHLLTFSFIPSPHLLGRPLKPDTDYSEDLANVPPENKKRVLEAEGFVYQWCHKEDEKEAVETGVSNGPLKRTRSFFRRTFSVSSQMFRIPSYLEAEIKEAAEEAEPFPEEWETAYDLRPWPDYPDQPSRA